MSSKSILLVGVPADHGSWRKGCLMGPDALRTAGIMDMLERLGYEVTDSGNLVSEPSTEIHHSNPQVHHLSDYAALISSLDQFCQTEVKDQHLPIFIGGDHCIAAGILPALARQSDDAGQEQFVLWLDAHTDFQTLESTDTGNLHGTPVTYMIGDPSFKGFFPAPAKPIKPENICMMGIRSVDPAERERIARTGIDVHDMRAIDEFGIAPPLRRFIDRVRRANGRLHVSLDIDFLDPGIAPAVGTTVAGGVNFREAHLMMEILYDSGLVTSLDIAELNPFLDDRGQTSKLVVDLIASLFGQRVLDTQTRSI
ncbi:arginase [uncultured Sneathiella sp.]|jgi:arginase|uniref:arginase n=1 Tax=uncultured Sneathiella sp. TaxID=879315 RepID=UPI0030DB77B0|tara:strand:+ start:51919 stop:52851 length:933 start_codon:yes stop_codon:yes gene_type:complete